MTLPQPQIFEPDARGITYVDDGDGPAVVLLPTRGLSVAYLSGLAGALVEGGFRVLRIGSRRPTAEAVTMHDLAKDVIDVMDHVQLADAWIAGHGFGGRIARTIALDHHDRANGILLIGVDTAAALTSDAQAAIDLLGTGPNHADLVSVMPSLAQADEDVNAVATLVEVSLDPTVAEMQAAASDVTPSAQWAQLAPGLPALLIHGSADRVDPVADARALQESAADRATLVLVEGGAYLFPATHPVETAAIIEDYLDWD